MEVVGVAGASAVAEDVGVSSAPVLAETVSSGLFAVLYPALGEARPYAGPVNVPAPAPAEVVPALPFVSGLVEVV